MRYKSQIQDKLNSIQNGLKQLRGQAERGEIAELRLKEEQLQERIEEILTLLNVNDETY
jgi:hypothetical protein